MNILILNSTSDLYGSSKILIYVLQSMIKDGHNPVVVLSEDGPLIAELNKINVPYYIIRLGILRRKYFTIPGLFNRMRVLNKAWKSLNRLIKEQKIDHIYSNTTGVLIGAFLAKRKNIKHTWHVHEIITSPKIFSKCIGYLLNNYTDQVIVVSDAVKDHWKKHVVVSKIKRIYNGIDCTPFEQTTASLKAELNIPEETVLIGMIGRVNNWKGQGYFLEIAKHLHKMNNNVHFVLAGDAYPGNENLVDELKETILQSEFPDCISYLGFRTDTPNLLQSMDIFVLPSVLPDPFPTVILEAMAASKPVIATEHGGALEMIANLETGIHIPTNDALKAANRMQILLSNPELRKKMGRAGNQRIHQLFSHKAFDKHIAQVF